MHVTEFRLIKNYEEGKADDLYRLVLYFLMEFNKRVHTFSDAISVRVQINAVRYLNIVTLGNKFNLRMDMLLNFIHKMRDNYDALDLNCLSFIILESGGIKGKGNGAYIISKLKHYKTNTIEPRRFLFNPQYTGYCGCISIVYGLLNSGLTDTINELLSNGGVANEGVNPINIKNIVSSVKNIQYKSNKNFNTLYVLGKLLANKYNITDEMSLFDFDKITSKNYRLRIVIFRNPDRLLYISNNDSNILENNKITIYLQNINNHYLYIKNIQSFANSDGKSRIHCNRCEYIFRDSEYKKHSCVKYVCTRCKKIIYNSEEIILHTSDIVISCTKCHLSFNDECYEHHFSTICNIYQKYKRCGICNVLYNPKSSPGRQTNKMEYIHECHKRYCNICMCVQNIRHRCFLSPKPKYGPKPESKSESRYRSKPEDLNIDHHNRNYYVYDIESFLDSL